MNVSTRNLGLVLFVLQIVTTGCGDGAPPPATSVPSTEDTTTTEAAALGCPTPFIGTGDHDVVITHEGRAHTFHVHVPAGVRASTRVPVVFSFHGGFGTADGAEQTAGLVPFSDANGFVLVRPEGSPATSGQVWNAGSCCGAAAETDQAVDHVGAVRVFLDTLQTQLCVDKKRVFATGHSNGGMFSYRLACELSDRIAAIASNAAYLMNRDLSVLPARTLFTCAPSRPVPVLHMHGLADGCAPINGGVSGLDPAIRPTARYGVDLFRVNNGCGATPTTTYSQGTASCSTWSGCSAGADVTYCTEGGAGHVWPGSTRYPAATRTQCGGDVTSDLQANTMLWNFFTTHPMP
ncbi:hypothetical protein OV208_39725 [Corallococcus sp. bb12-1]|uniref:alpha/beta hydrolase family esterase n=1 Tax=Corallococcus sp. bb12-1 TaxID=2996784 RepID=UPI00226F32FB|nr:PHB depolymerase family esterase [Corallococcus sp. bb12-1]MCY1047496.1 hypothetical protein [Corallococcus sp. bb12-1]